MFIISAWENFRLPLYFMLVLAALWAYGLAVGWAIQYECDNGLVCTQWHYLHPQLAVAAWLSLVALLGVLVKAVRDLK